MNRIRRSSLFIVWCVLATTPGPSFAQSPTLGWKLTDLWELTVERHGANAEVSTYSATVRVVAPANPEGTPAWWVLRFEPSADAPEKLRGRPIVWIEKHTGWLGKVSITDAATSEQSDMPLEMIADATVLREPVDGLPLEMLFPNQEARVLGSAMNKSKVEITRERSGKQTTVEAAIHVPGKDVVKISQVWKAGESWWSEYTRWIGQRVRLRAKLAKVQSTEETERIVREDPNCHLAWDKRLCVRMTFVSENPKMSDLLEAIRVVTGMQLSLTGTLDHHDPTLGSVQLRDAPAWVGMKLIAAECFEDGEWESVENGYRLKAHRLKSASTQTSKLTFEKTRNWLMISLLTLVAIVLVLAYFRLRRPENDATEAPPK